MRTIRLSWGQLRTPLALAAAMLLVGGALAWLSGLFVAKIEPGTADGAVRRLADQQVDEVHEVTKEYFDEAVGTLRSATRTVISAKVMATIEDITVKAGDRVEQGAVLVRLDRKELEARLEQARGALAAAEATLSQARSDYERYAALRRTNVRAISQQEFDAAHSRVLVAEADKARIDSAVHEAAVQLSYATIEAPQEGTVVDRLAEPGDTARPGEPLLVLYDVRTLRIEAPVPESLAVRLSIGQTLGVHVDALNRDIEATVSEIVPQAEAASRTFLVKASLADVEGMYEGMFARLLIPAGSRRHLCLATSAVETVGQLEFVEVVRDDGTIERRLVKTGRVGIPGRVEVLSGVRAGERVVIR